MRRYKNKNCPIDLDIPILQEYVKKRDIVALYIDKWSENSPVTIEIWIDLMKMKKADVVEVVRCRDCAYYREENGYCMNPHCSSSFYGHRVNEYHYCSYGERRVEE